MHMPEAADPGTVPLADDSARLDGIVKRFDDAWQAGQQPSIAAHLPADARGRQAVLPKLVDVDLERRLKTGEPVRVEGYLEQYPDLAGDDEGVLGLIVHEYKLRRSLKPASPSRSACSVSPATKFPSNNPGERGASAP